MIHTRYCVPDNLTSSMVLLPGDKYIMWAGLHDLNEYLNTNLSTKPLASTNQILVLSLVWIVPSLVLLSNSERFFCSAALLWLLSEGKIVCYHHASIPSVCYLVTWEWWLELLDVDRLMYTQWQKISSTVWLSRWANLCGSHKSTVLISPVTVVTNSQENKILVVFQDPALLLPTRHLTPTINSQVTYSILHVTYSITNAEHIPGEGNPPVLPLLGDNDDPACVGEVGLSRLPGCPLL